MSITFSCSQCGQRYQVDGAHAGKRIKCKKCTAVVGVPVPHVVAAAQVDSPPRVPRALKTFGSDAPPAATARGASTVPKAPAPPPRPAPRAAPPPAPAPTPAASSGLDLDDLELDDVPASNGPVLRRLQPAPAAAEGATEEAKPKKKKKKRKKKRTSTSLDGAEAIKMVAAVVVGVAVLVGVGVAIPGMRAMIALPLMIIGAILAFLGNWAFSNAAREEGYIHFLMCRWVPLYKAYFLLSRWQTMREHILFYGIGVTMLSGGVMLWAITPDPTAEEESDDEPVASAPANPGQGKAKARPAEDDEDEFQ